MTEKSQQMQMASKCVELEPSDPGFPNCCETTAEYSKCHITWSVNNFTHLRQGYGDGLESCIFFNKDTADDLKYQLLLYPNGNEKAVDDIVVALKLVTDDDDLRALVKYSCWICYKGKAEKAWCVKSGDAFMTPGSHSKYISLVRREELLKRRDEFLPNDKLTIVCKVSSSYKEVTRDWVPKRKS